MNVYRGDIYFVDWANDNSPVGSELWPGRPAVVVSNNENNMKLNTVQVVYLTSKEKPLRHTHAKVMCRVPSTAMCEQLTTIDQSRLRNYVRTCSEGEMAAIDAAIMKSLNLEGLSQEAAKELSERADYFQKQCEEARNINMVLTEENRRQRDENALRLAAERDTYKAMYEALLDRMMTVTKEADK